MYLVVSYLARIYLLIPLAYALLATVEGAWTLRHAPRDAIWRWLTQHLPWLNEVSWLHEFQKVLDTVLMAPWLAGTVLAAIAIAAFPLLRV